MYYLAKYKCMLLDNFLHIARLDKAAEVLL